MKSDFARRLLIVAMGAVVFAGLVAAGRAQTNSAPNDADLAAREKAACINNLKVIYDAIQAYKNDHKDVPNYLSDLVPEYLSDMNVLVCPTARRTGRQERPELIDPRIPSTYLYEFTPAHIKGLSNSPVVTHKEWKRRQMALVGPDVPIVRCRHDKRFLNVGYDGRIYESAYAWERLFTNETLSLDDLTPAHLFALENGVKAAAAPASAAPPQDFPGRINLAKYYNAALAGAWLSGAAAGDLAALPVGPQKFAGVEFDVRGIIQLEGESPQGTNYPAKVRSIHIHQKCQNLHFLQAAAAGGPADEGRQIGSYVVYYATNQMRLEIPIVYGRDVRNWHAPAGEAPPSGELTVAWTEASAGSTSRPARLFLTTWKNFLPDVQIDRIDFVSNLAGPAPFLVAITTD